MPQPPIAGSRATKDPQVTVGPPRDGLRPSSLARNEEPNSGNTEFFICLDDQPDYDYGGDASPDGKGYVTFGKVIKGMKFVRQIQKQPDFETNLRPPIKIIDIIRL